MDIVYFCFCTILKQIAAMYVLYALQLKLWLRSNLVSKTFLLRKCTIDHGPQTQNEGQTRT